MKKFDKIDITSRLLNLILDMSMADQLSLLKKLDKSCYEGARRHVRKKVNKRWAVVINEDDDIRSNDYIKDICSGGMYIETKKPFSVGQEIKLYFKLPNNEKVFEVFGEIIRQSATGIGVKFTRKVQEENASEKLPSYHSNTLAN